MRAESPEGQHLKPFAAFPQLLKDEAQGVFLSSRDRQSLHLPSLLLGWCFSSEHELGKVCSQLWACVHLVLGTVCLMMWLSPSSRAGSLALHLCRAQEASAWPLAPPSDPLASWLFAPGVGSYGKHGLGGLGTSIFKFNSRNNRPPLKFEKATYYKTIKGENTFKIPKKKW